MCRPGTKFCKELERRRFTSRGMTKVLQLLRTKLALLLGGSAKAEQSTHLSRLALGFDSSHLRQSRLQLGLQLSIARLRV